MTKWTPLGLTFILLAMVHEGMRIDDEVAIDEPDYIYNIHNKQSVKIYNYVAGCINYEI